MVMFVFVAKIEAIKNKQNNIKHPSNPKDNVDIYHDQLRT